MIWKSYFLKGVQIGKEWIHELNHQNLGPWNPNTLFGVVKTNKQTKTKWKTTKTKNKNKPEKQLKNRLAYFITGRGLLIPAEPDVRPCSHNFRFCHGFNTSLIPNPQGFPPFFHHFCHYWFHSVAFFPRCTLCSINSIITEGSKPATSPNNMYKGLIMVIVCHVFFHDITSLQKLQKDLNLPPPPTNTYKDLLMIMLYSILWKIKSGAKGPLSARKPRIRENLSKTRVVLPEKNRFRANVRICAYYFFPECGVLNCGGSSNGTRTLYYVWFAFSLPTILFVLHWFTRTC